ncbi:MAG: alanine--tRNA ligase [Planctomycetota bacterium]
MTTTATRTAAQIRQEFIDFFTKKQGHAFAPSSPVVPHDDPTLLFTNAGMNQFKDVFLGQGTRDFVRAANTQKCIRAGGKHNDLEDVGKDTYHHTFFEMLGNWSFGDYFKVEAIAWAWELLVTEWGIDPDRLYVTVFEGDASDGTESDTDAENIWKQFVPADRIGRFDKKDNFWEMGETGPCGPCSEIHYDGRTDEERAREPGAELVNKDHPDVIEIWNLVFIQFNRGEGGALTPLPAQHVDTGMGFERIVRVLQHKSSNYDTDVWTPIFDAIRTATGAREYTSVLDDPIDIAYRVIADHIRCLTIALTDGARPGNEGRGYVLRRILRRAVRIARQTLGVDRPVLNELVPSVVESLGGAFPELRTNPDRIATIIREEEEAFLRTIDRGLVLFDEAASSAKNTQISAEHAFGLHDTYGFPIDLTRIMAEERGLTVDEAGYESLMAAAREKSRGKDENDPTAITLPPEALAQLKYKDVAPTDDVDKFHGRPTSAHIRAIWNGTDFDNVVEPVGKRPMVAIITDKTNFYAEQGGQIADTGTIVDVDGDKSTFEVLDVQRVGDYVMHIGRLVDGELREGEPVQMMLHRPRREMTKSNHTATHVLNHALRVVMHDEEIDQRGSLVADDRLRFDFSCARGMTPDEIEEVEAHVNRVIAQNLEVFAELVPLDKAQQIHGLRAVFGERYPDPVRVVSVGVPVPTLLETPDNPDWSNHSIEFCGGTHLDFCGDAKHFVITQESALAAGIRRVIALTGPAAMAAETAARTLEDQLAAADALEGESFISAVEDASREVDELSLGTAARTRLRARLEPLREKVKAIRKSAQAENRGAVVEQARKMADMHSGPVFVNHVEGANKETLLNAMDVIRAKHENSAAMLFSADRDEGKVMIVATVPKELIGKGLKAGDWVKLAAGVCGGGGGGRPDMAQAGGKDPEKIDDAIAQAREFAWEKVND